MKQKIEISLSDLISEISGKENLEKNNDIEDAEDLLVKEFIGEFEKREKYLDVIKSLEEKKVNENEFYDNILIYYEKSKIIRESKVFDFNFKLRALFLSSIMCFLFFGLFFKINIFLPLFIVVGIFFVNYIVKNYRKNEVLKKNAYKEKMSYVEKLEQEWNSKVKSDKNYYNPYVFVYFYLNNSKDIDKSVLATVFENFSFENIKLDLNSMSELFFSSAQDESAERGYKNYEGMSSDDIPDRFEKAYRKRSNTTKLNFIKNALKKENNVFFKEKVLSKLKDKE